MYLFKKITVTLLIFSFFSGKSQQNLVVKSVKGKIISTRVLEKFIEELKVHDFIFYYDKKFIPISTFKSLINYNKEFSIANPKEKYQTNCVNDKNLPKRRLILILKNKNNLILTYNIGGFAISTHILFLNLKEDKITDLWSGKLSKNVKNKKEILSFIEENLKKNTNRNDSSISI